MDLKTCATCEKTYLPSSRHKSCPKCRAKTYKKLCICGKKIQKVSTLCVDCHNGNAVGENNPNWKGGTTYHKKGYKMCYTSEGYIFEHRLVMEDHLGRKLLKSENIHHKNGVKDDNRLENLELWSTGQPAGQRVSDLIVYALDLLSLYGTDPTVYEVD